MFFGGFCRVFVVVKT